MYDSLIKNILIVEDDEDYRSIIHESLEIIGYSCRSAADAFNALKMIPQQPPDLVITDIVMEGKNGLELMQEIHKDFPELPFIIVTGNNGDYSYGDIINAGAVDFINKPFTLTELQAKVQRIEREKANLRQLQESLIKLQKLYEKTIGTLASALGNRDPYTAGHQNRVASLACAIAQEIDFPQKDIDGLRLATLVHDIGKICIPIEILVKPGKLSDIEMSFIQTHSQMGFQILNGIEYPWPIAEIVLQHHERIDGSGYPQGLAGEDIRLEARIMGVADVVEAMSSHRPYRPALGIEKALKEISKNRGILYDPEVVDVCVRLFNEDGFQLE